MSSVTDLIKKIEKREYSVGVIGLGYVGLPLVQSFGKAGFSVIGFDIDQDKVKQLSEGKSYIKHINAGVFLENKEQYKFTTDFSLLKTVDAIIICVPTPLDAHREPDMTYVFSTAKTIASYIKKEQLIVLESTTYPGTTDTDVRIILEKSGLKAGEDFFLVFSPEREDPGNKDFSTSQIPKLVGGFTDTCRELGVALYSSAFSKVVPVSSCRVAESAKLLENIYRAVNIALVNELKLLFDRMDIDIWEVIEAAKTKPFGFHAFYPGPGLGGHCIPIDPFYLTWKAREYDFSTRFIELAGEINTSMPYFVVDKTIEALNTRSIAVKDAKILILGIAYKKDVDDMRESPSLKLIELFLKNGAKVDYNDPYLPSIPSTRKYNFGLSSVPIDGDNLRNYDAVVVATDHSIYDYDFIGEKAKLIIDTRNVIPVKYSDKVVKA